MVNGKLVQDTLFTVTTNADVKAIFSGQDDEKCITLTVPAGNKALMLSEQTTITLKFY